MNISSITDIPRNVSLGEKDTFGIEPFENGLTKFIEHTNTPITIALQGEWGSGKTSLMNSLNENLSDDGKLEYHSVWLNTWEYALMKDASTTLIDIITKLIDEVTKIANVNKEKKNQLLMNVKKIGFSVLKVASSVNSITSSAMEEVEKSMNQEQNVTISQIRNELETIIKDCVNEHNKKGFIFFIDDLDRIDPPVAVQLLELLKNIFTLKKCVFILAIDYDVVIKGLEPKFGKLSEQNEREFRSFFDKIIQVPFSMPVSSYVIDTFLKESLISINYISEENASNEKLIANFSEISNLSVGTNPRALKRLMNSLSLISCINSAKGSKQETDQLNEELELLVNFALVSIQIAYPPVYRLLSLHSAFDKWNENIALQMNLKQLDEQSINKLNKSEEFDEEWEKVLFRLCENDHYLKKRALSISRLLNTLKTAITEQGEDVEDTIGSIISLSSVTNLEAFDQPVIDYHRGSFLKHLRNLLIPQLKNQLPEIADLIKTQGKRVQSNAFIKFTKNDWAHYIKLHSHPHEGGVRLILVSDKWMAHSKNHNSVADAIKEVGFEKELRELESDYNNFIENHQGYASTNFLDQVVTREGHFVVEIYSYLTLPNIDAFYQEATVKRTSAVIADMYRFLVRMQKLKEKIWEVYQKN
ncbi:KAP family P-loop NTPase fold protein [Winogradskyella forsetii]|uniref:KAP family P-loop NTPase fold protein n=1 Tax=Winogradskyella forsetii TaxID=2686077 RepID=UPI0015BC3EE9|nr:P-loop NTPase fold protein [Winogradskyella forsetii]